MKSLILSLLILVGLSKAADVNLSGKIDLSQAGRSATVSVVTSTGLTGTVSQDGSYTITGTTSLRSTNIQKDSPKLSWKTFGKELQITGVGVSENYTVDAWTIDGKSVGVRVPFQNGIAKFSGVSSEKIFVRLNYFWQEPQIASRSLSDTTLGTVYFIVNDPSNEIVNDTLTEIPVTNWIGVLGPKYIVGRNVDVTVPNAFVGDTVKVGWFNTYTNPSNYYSIVLGNPNGVDYSGFVYTAYDSASYGNNEYLYSAVSIIKHGDSVVAFSLDTLLVDSALTGHVWNTGDGSITNILDSAHFINPGYKTIGADTLSMDVVSAYAVIEVDTAFDSLALTYYGYRAPYAYDGVKVYNTKHFQVGTDTANFDHIVALRAEPASRQSTSLFLNDVNYQVTKFSLSRFYLVRRGVAVYYK
jgi:hypothetical protein